MKQPIQTTNLDHWRHQIDEIDGELLALFEKRMTLAKKIGAYKREHQLPLYHPLREKEVLEKVIQNLPDELKNYGKIWFSTLMDVSKVYQGEAEEDHGPQMNRVRQQRNNAPAFFPRSGRVAFQGTYGSYSHLACEKLFSQPQLRECITFEDVFSALDGGECDFGVLPLENSTYGSVAPVFDLLKRYAFPIAKSLRLHVSHHLLAKPGGKPNRIKEVYSHEQALGQCGLFFRRNPHLRQISTTNTAFAAKKVAETADDTVAAIGSKEAARAYGLEILEENIQSTENNYTRFVCVSREPVIYPGADKITIVIALPHQRGALYQILSQFAALGINLTKLESRPVPGSDFQFLFYLDLQGSIEDPAVFHLLSQLEKQVETFFFLGNYSEVS